VKNNRAATRSNLSSRSLNKNLLFFTFSDITFHQSFPVLIIMKEGKVVAVHFYLLNIKKHALVTIYLLAIGVTPESPHKPACNQWYSSQTPKNHQEMLENISSRAFSMGMYGWNSHPRKAPGSQVISVV